MPAKRRLLPRPCPICGKENGTVQIVIWHNSFKVNCRIGHYDSKTFQNPATPKEKRRRGKKWCYFLMDESFAKENILPLERDIDDLYMGNLGKRKSITYTSPSLLLETIKEEGWHGEGSPYFRGLIKTLGLWEEFTKDHFPLSDDETYREFILSKRPKEKL